MKIREFKYMHAYMHNMTKVISLSDDAYLELKKMKGEGESFSDVVIKITKKERKPLSYFLGKWPDTPETKRIVKELEEERKNAKMRDWDF